MILYYAHSIGYRAIMAESNLKEDMVETLWLCLRCSNNEELQITLENQNVTPNMFLVWTHGMFLSYLLQGLGLCCCTRRDRMVRCFAIHCSGLGLRCCTRRDRMVLCYTLHWQGLTGLGLRCCVRREPMVRCLATLSWVEPTTHNQQNWQRSIIQWKSKALLCYSISTLTSFSESCQTRAWHWEFWHAQTVQLPKQAQQNLCILTVCLLMHPMFATGPYSLSTVEPTLQTPGRGS